MAKITLSGEITKASTEQMSKAIKGILYKVGDSAARKMRVITKEHDATGRLTGSITWQTTDKGTGVRGRAKQSDRIDAPSDGWTVDIGSAAPHAVYREKESGVHRNKDGHVEFIKAMKEWFQIRFGLNPDSGDSKDLFWSIVQSVRENITYGDPFIKPTKDEIGPIASSAMRTAFREFWRVQKK